MCSSVGAGTNWTLWSCAALAMNADNSLETFPARVRIHGADGCFLISAWKARTKLPWFLRESMEPTLRTFDSAGRSVDTFVVRGTPRNSPGSRHGTTFGRQ